MQWKTMRGSRARTCGNTASANQRTASTLGGWRKPPTNTRSRRCANGAPGPATWCRLDRTRSEEHTSELQSLMRISYAVFCLKKNKTDNNLKESPTRQDSATTLLQRHTSDLRP